MRAVLIEPDMSGGGARVFDMTMTLPNLEELLGGCPETVSLRAPVPALGYVNERGKRLGLPVNVVASEIARIADDDYVAGRMLVLGGVNEEGDDTPVSDELLLWLLEAHEAKELHYLRSRVWRLGVDRAAVEAASREELVGALIRAGV